MLQELKQRSADVLHAGRTRDPISRLVDVSLIGLITLNVLAVILESVPAIYQPLAAWFFAFEVFSVAVFTIEYIMRVWSVTENPWRDRYRHPLWGRLRYVFSVMALIDLLAILPFYLSVFMSIDLRFLRVMRLLRILKLTRYSTAMTMLFEVLRAEARVIGSSLFVLVLLLVVTSSLIYLVEHQAQPEGFGTIPRAMWWSIITMTTVGFGDVVPITGPGKILGGLMGVIGIGMVALPAGILASGFNQALHTRRESLRRDVSEALDDGVINTAELAALEAKRSALNLSESDLRDLLLELSKYRRGHPVESDRCPHCGKPTGDQAMARE